MKEFKFNKTLYDKIALIKAAYNFTDIAYIHLDADDSYYYVRVEFKDKQEDISEESFVNEMLVQSLRHEVYLQTKNIRELLLARALSSSVIYNLPEIAEECIDTDDRFTENEVLKDWFSNND